MMSKNEMSQRGGGTAEDIKNKDVAEGGAS